MSEIPAAIEIPRSLIDKIYVQSREEFPNECCGWLLGNKGQHLAIAARACVNAQSSGRHPTAPQRGAETAYVIDGEDLLALNDSFDSDLPAIVIYHSHPNGQAYLSPTDREVATSPWGDGPAYPVQQLVVGIDNLRVVEAILYAWSEGEGGFVEVANFEGSSI